MDDDLQFPPLTQASPKNNPIEITDYEPQNNLDVIMKQDLDEVNVKDGHEEDIDDDAKILKDILYIHNAIEKHGKLQEFLQDKDRSEDSWNEAYEELCQIEDKAMNGTLDSDNYNEMDNFEFLNDEDGLKYCDNRVYIDGFELIDDEVKDMETLSTSTSRFLRDMLTEPADMCEEVEEDGSAPEDLYVNEDEWEDILMTLTADSGAGNHVLSREDAPGYAVASSEGSRKGKGFVGVDGVRIPNEGQVELNLAGPQGRFKSTFQVAKVTRPLMSIARICDRGHRVIFEKSHASVLNEQGQEVCRFARRGNLYMIDVKLKAPSAGFTRRGD